MVRIINFYELSQEWQAEAIDNLGDEAEEAMYLEPEEGTNPREHVLWDLSDAMPQRGTYKGFEYNAVISISNTGAMLLRISDDSKWAETKIVS
jgi:hypothetical protein